MTCRIMMTDLGVFVDDGWLKQPHHTSDGTQGLGEACTLLHIEQSVCTGETSRLHSQLGVILDVKMEQQAMYHFQ